jgi:hypothetical protein
MYGRYAIRCGINAVYASSDTASENEQTLYAIR